MHGKRHPTLNKDVIVGASTRNDKGLVHLRSVAAKSTEVGITGQVIHQSAVKIDPQAHSATPDAEVRANRIYWSGSTLSRQTRLFADLPAGGGRRPQTAGGQRGQHKILKTE